MYDSVDLAQIPDGAQAVGCYEDGRYVNAAQAAARFPRAHILTIATSAAHDADCLDIETGDATPDQAPGWYRRQRARGVARPCLYASAFRMDTEVAVAITAAGIARSAVRLWTAHYSGQPHVCGPASCRELGVAADGTQWTDRAANRNLDRSLLADDFFGAAPTWTETLVNSLPTLKPGDTDKAGQVFYVHRMQALVAVVGQINKLPAAASLAADGTYSPATTAAVKAVQKISGLTPDGVCGPKTWAALVAGQHG